VKRNERWTNSAIWPALAWFRYDFNYPYLAVN
jgi:hypothetical protein